LANDRRLRGSNSLEPEFGKPKVFRPFRDVRFAKEETADANK